MLLDDKTLYERDTSNGEPLLSQELLVFPFKRLIILLPEFQ
jgi:hypothetical protein